MDTEHETRKHKEETRERNTERGLRSCEKALERNVKRSIKRNLARRAKRKQNGGNSPSRGQEPEKHENEENKKIEILKWDYEKEITTGTLNIRGLKEPGKRETVEVYMKTRKIKILLLQETHINKNCMEQRKNTLFILAEI